MLEELHVANLGLLADARLEPGQGLVVVTGETGAGKTMLLGALQLLAGDTARRDRVGPAADDLFVEGRFATPDGERVAARKVTREGRSRAYVDGSMATAAQLGESFGAMMEIVAQHDALRLATIEGAAAIGLEREIGSLEVGKKADLVVLDTGRPELWAAAPVDLHDLVAFSACRAHVRHVFVEGEQLVEDGRLTHFDLDTVQREAGRAVRSLLKRSGLAL